MHAKNTILSYLTIEQLKSMLRELIQEELEHIKTELQLVMGEDDLIATGTATRLLGTCNKLFYILVQEGHFTVYKHLKERRFSRGEILEYRNKSRKAKKRLVK